MSKESTLNQIKVLLGLDAKVEVKFEQAKLEGDVTIEADVFESGNEVFVITEDARIPLPVGEYKMEDGRVLVVEQDGLIASIGEMQVEEEAPVAEEEVEVEASQEATPKKVVESVSKEIHFSDEQKETLKSLFSEWYAELSKVEEVEVIEEKKETELSEQAPKAIKHTPEKGVQKKEVKLFSKNRKMGIVDRIFEKQLNRK